MPVSMPSVVNCAGRTMDNMPTRISTGFDTNPCSCMKARGWSTNSSLPVGMRAARPVSACAICNRGNINFSNVTNFDARVYEYMAPGSRVSFAYWESKTIGANSPWSTERASSSPSAPCLPRKSVNRPPPAMGGELMETWKRRRRRSWGGLPSRNRELYTAPVFCSSFHNTNRYEPVPGSAVDGRTNAVRRM